jgi:hypothetical protein
VALWIPVFPFLRFAELFALARSCHAIAGPQCDVASRNYQDRQRKMMYSDQLMSDLLRETVIAIQAMCDGKVHSSQAN